MRDCEKCCGFASGTGTWMASGFAPMQIASTTQTGQAARIVAKNGKEYFTDCKEEVEDYAKAHRRYSA